MSKKPSFRRDGVTYNLTTDEVAVLLEKSIDWVRTHAAALGGRKEAWSDGFKRPATYRFPSKGLKGRCAEVEAQMKANRASRRV